ncbi:hypothetical protein ABPG75_006314 [Micractinium tetrahymenae]
MDVSVTALPGGRYAWACNTCAAPGAPAAAAAAVIAARPAAAVSPVAQQLAAAQLSPRARVQPTPWRLSSVEAAALRALPMPVWVCDPRGRCLFANAAFCRLAGCDEGAAAGRPWTQLLPRPGHPEDACAVQQVEAAIAVGQPVAAEVRRRDAAPGGSSGGRTEGGQPGCAWFGTITVSPLEEPGSSAEGSTGSAPLLVCTLTGGPSEAAGGGSTAADASAAQGGPGVQPAPPALAQLCNQALASTSEGVVITDPSQPGNPIVWANAAFERMTGYSQEAVLGRSHALLQGPDTDPVVLADIAAAMDEGRPVVAEILVYRCDGSSFWCQISITPILDAATGRVANFVAVQRDISQRKAVEAASHVREQALSNLNEGICICDATLKDCPVVYVNNAFLRITGYSRSEVIGRNCRFLQGPKTDPATVQRLATALHEGREITVELLNYRKSGEEFYNMLSITPVRDASGRLLSFIGVQSDITELVRRRQAEKELQEAKVAAETAAEAKSMFLANMSHEIRTPLNGMIAVAQLLLSSGLTPEQRELTDTILESGNTLLTILGDILDFSKIDHNSMVLESAPVALRDMLEASIEMVAADAGRKGLDVAYTLEPPLVARRLMGDSIRIRQILSNLLSNAVKFTTAGEVVVEAWAETTPPAAALAREGRQRAPSAEGAAQRDGDRGLDVPGRPRLHITVKDTGIGISDASMARLFQQFRQGHESMSRRYVGTGLGLAISRRLAQMMGGNVWAESVEGKGSTFHFTAALHWEGEAPAAADGSTAAAAAAAAAGTAGSTATAPQRSRGASASFDSSLAAADSLPASRRASESNEQSQPRRRPSSCSAGGESGGAAGSSSAGTGTGTAATAATDDSCGASSAHGAEEQRLLLQQHHEALLHRLAQRTAAEGSAAGGEGPALSLSPVTEAPDTPCAPSVAPLPRFGTIGGSSSMLASLTGSYRSLQSLPGLLGAAGSVHSAQQPQQGQRSGSSDSRHLSVASGQRGSSDTAPAAAPAAHQRGSDDSIRSCPERVSVEQGRPVRPPPPPVDFRMSAFYAPSKPIKPANPPPRSAVRQRSRDSSPRAAAAAAPAAARADAPTEQEKARAACPPGAVPAALPAAAPGVPASDRAGTRSSSSDCCGASSLSAPPAPLGLAAAATVLTGPPSQGGSSDWGGASGSSEPGAVLRGRRVCIDVAHGPTAVQVAQSCQLLGMEAELERCQQAAATAGSADFCITTADKALAAVRAGWRGRPLVVLGRREELPSNLQPLATTVSKPVKHTRLVGALLKANAFSRSKQQAPLHLDPHMLSLLPERMLLNPLAGATRRISLDNSALDRRRWEMAAAAAAAAAANNDSTLSPLHHGSAHSSAAGDLLTASLAAAGTAAAAAPGPSSGGWQPDLAVIHSDGSREGSQRSSLDMGPAAAPAAAAGSTAAGAAGAAAGPAPPALRILVAEDNLINQRVIRKVLQRVVPAAEVEIVGNGALALAAVHRTSFDLVLMDIHMPEMDGLEASRRLQAELPPDRRPVVVALSADTLQELHEQCRGAGIREFICKPFRVEDVERVLALVRPRMCSSSDGRP